MMVSRMTSPSSAVMDAPAGGLARMSRSARGRHGWDSAVHPFDQCFQVSRCLRLSPSVSCDCSNFLPIRRPPLMLIPASRRQQRNRPGAQPPVHCASISPSAARSAAHCARRRSAAAACASCSIASCRSASFPSGRRRCNFAHRLPAAPYMSDSSSLCPKAFLLFLYSPPP